MYRPYKKMRIFTERLPLKEVGGVWRPPPPFILACLVNVRELSIYLDIFKFVFWFSCIPCICFIGSSMYMTNYKTSWSSIPPWICATWQRSVTVGGSISSLTCHMKKWSSTFRDSISNHKQGQPIRTFPWTAPRLVIYLPGASPEWHTVVWLWVQV